MNKCYHGEDSDSSPLQINGSVPYSGVRHKLENILPENMHLETGQVRERSQLELHVQLIYCANVFALGGTGLLFSRVGVIWSIHHYDIVHIISYPFRLMQL